MTKKAGWEEPSTGPDWMDAESLMRAVGALHSAHVAIIVSPHGNGFSGGLDVAASAMFDVLPDSQLPSSVVVDGTWPSSNSKTLAALAFSLLHQLDFAIGEVYKQGKLWE